MSTNGHTDQPSKTPGICERLWGGVFLVITAVLIATLYSYAVLYLLLSAHLLSLMILIFLLVFIFFMLMWSYKVTHSTPTLPIPQRFEFTPVEWAFLESRAFLSEDTRYELCAWATARGIRTRGYNGQVNICRTCRIMKPERTHHCRICRKCIPKMDHHCPFFGNCIHFGNFKAFLLTLFYATLGFLYIIVATAVCTVSVGAEKAFQTLNEDVVGLVAYIALLIFSVMAELSLGAFFWTSFRHAMHNHTTLEHIGGSVIFASGSKESYDLGSFCKNMKNQFGPSIAAWFIPKSTTPGDGVTFPVRSQIEELTEVRPAM
ncbi:palmitoyltransferase ZDHHC15 [Galendromus occidentalis]|uniref:Palmitoyltransferase n=1 Tax=Galendromus occidentalis TaxID=34638 RepID=A0AAJ7L5F8_9ACAR|nr:palmitoyltransferase ZDHHC15 [Galendromus occidentalis]